jgi:hypothetical protein
MVVVSERTTDVSVFRGRVGNGALASFPYDASAARGHHRRRFRPDKFYCAHHEIGFLLIQLIPLNNLGRDPKVKACTKLRFRDSCVGFAAIAGIFR